MGDKQQSSSFEGDFTPEIMDSFWKRDQNPGWQEKVILYLQFISGGIEPEAARREAESLRNSPDLNEAWIAEIVAQAAELLAESP